ncbi:MAG: ABC transporter ATP-binding protein [Asticcacaulis sp.]
MSYDMGGRGGPTAGGTNGAHGEDIFSAVDVRILRRFLTFVRPYRLELIGVLVVVLIFVGTQVSIPLAIRFAIDSALGDKAIALDWVIAGFLGLIAVNAVVSFLQEWSAAVVAQKVIFDLRRAMFVHLQDVSTSFIDQTHVGRIMSRIQGDVNALQEFLETSVQAVGDLFLLIGIITVLMLMDWQLALLTLSALPVLVVVRAIWLPYAKKTFRHARDTSSIVNGVLAENINGVRVVQGSQRESVNFSAFETRAKENFSAQIKAAWAAQIMVPSVDILTGICQAIVVIVGGTAVLMGRLEVGVMVAFIFFVQRFFDPIRTLSLQYTVMQRAMAAGYRIFEVLDVPVTIKDKPDALNLHHITPSVEFSNVTFGYVPDRPVLHDLSFRIEPGQTVALVGPTGSGKSSIASLTLRFFDVTAGAVKVDGHDVRDVTLDSLGRTIAMVLQEPFLFTGTVFENIRYNTGATRHDVIAAAKAVSAHAFIEQLPQGYDTPLEQRGQNLSQGQRQLLSFARALVADPDILILDEATASIDSVTEQKIQSALRTLLKGRTSLIIAHRLATVRDADNIIVLQQGRILEQGSHEALVERDGFYASLFRKNYASFDDAMQTP